MPNGMPTDDEPNEPPAEDVTVLLRAWGRGETAALDRLTPLIYAELQRLARRYMSREQVGSTMETGALLNEAFLRLVHWKPARFENRSHFYGLASQIMRRVLVDHARSRGYQKRGGKQRPVSLEEAMAVAPERNPDIVALDDALNRLAVFDERKSKVVELRFFGGLSNEETAEVLKISSFTVIRDWNLAKVWLHRELRSGNAEG